MIIRGRDARPGLLVVGGVGAAGLLFLGSTLLPASATTDPTPARSVSSPTQSSATPATGSVTEAPEAENVRQAFTRALIVDRQLGNPASMEQLRLRPVPAATIDLQAAGRESIPSLRDRQRRVTRDRKNIRAHFASAAAVASENRALDGTMVAVASANSRILGAGVSQVTVTSVKVSGRTATIVARAHVWTKGVFRQQTGGSWLDASPAGDQIYQARLAKGEAGTWMVTDMTSRFANGSGP